MIARKLMSSRLLLPANLPARVCLNSSAPMSSSSKEVSKPVDKIEFEYTEGVINLLPFDYATKIFGRKQTRVPQAFGCVPIMIRKPALTVMEYLRQIDGANVRILLYGDNGAGKTHTLYTILHHLYSKQERLVLNLHNARRLTRSPMGFNESTSRPGCVDTPVNAAVLLQQFKLNNQDLLDKHSDALVCSKDYTWSLREVTKAGEPLVNVIEHGVNRLNHASDCVAVLCKELAIAADAGKIKLATVIDQAYFLFTGNAGVLKHEDNKFILVDEMTMAKAFKKLIKSTCKNSVVIAACANELSIEQNQTPRQILGIEGWNYFDPYLPVHVPKYSREEFDTMMDFFLEMGWICRPEARTGQARDEIRFVSGMNPAEVNFLCKAL